MTSEHLLLIIYIGGGFWITCLFIGYIFWSIQSYKAQKNFEEYINYHYGRNKDENRKS